VNIMPFDPTAWWNLLISGKIFEAVLATYTSTLGFWFYTIILFMGMLMIYLKTNNFGTTIGTGVLLFGVAIPFMPDEVANIAFVMTALGFTFILYKVFH